jgi:myo-inositol-1(or 4)-monophosphatase
VLATVFDPVRQELFLSAGEQATCNGRRMAVTATEQLEHAVLSVLFKPTDAARPEVVALTTRLRARREFGATALELAWVAAGRIDGCLFRRTESVWDWAAGAQLVLDAGGAVEPAGVSVPAATIAAGHAITSDIGAVPAGQLSWPRA